MNTKELLASLDDDCRLNESLELIEYLIVDTPDVLILKLQILIDYPEKITNTNRFASLLAHFSSEKFIEPLIRNIKLADPVKTMWLADYMYALDNCLEELDEIYVPDVKFVHLLGDWLLNTQGGEISWKSSLILSELNHPQCTRYNEEGALCKGLLDLSRIVCLRGLVNVCGLEKLNIYQQMLEDEDQKIVEAAKSAIAWLNKQSRLG